MRAAVREFCSSEIEVICADAFQAYAGLDIGTAKPSPGERREYSYKLIDILQINEQYSAGMFFEYADAACRDILSRGRIPVMEGGSVFYIYTFLTGLPDAPKTSDATRQQLQMEIEQKGIEWLRQELERIDSAASQRIPSGDRYRIQRAVEIYRESGRLPSEFLGSAGLRDNLNACVLGLERERAVLHTRIARRVEEMFEQGLSNELEGLLDQGFGPKDPGLRAIGYQEFWRDDGDRETDFLKVSELIQRNTRRLAKRQITFLQRIPGIKTGAAESNEWLRNEVRTFAETLH
ncbi:tRNA (adenosine(37)-N6)-dimethylallyltransferase MiaA [Spirochaeta dissipatitropha]